MKSTCFFFRTYFIRTLQLYMHFHRKTELKFKKERKCLSAYVNIGRSRAQQRVIGRCRPVARIVFVLKCEEIIQYSYVRRTVLFGKLVEPTPARLDSIKMTVPTTKTRTGLVQYAWLLNDDVLRSHTERVHHFIELILMNNVGA